MKSHPNYPLKVNAVSLNTVDVLTMDPDGEHLRMDVRAFFRNDDASDRVIGVFYKGIIKIDEAFEKMLKGGDTGTEWGNCRKC